MKKFLKKLLLPCLLMFGVVCAFGQRGGIPSFTASDDFADDTINLVTLTPILHFSILPKGAGTSINVISPQSCHQVNQSGNTNLFCGYQTYLLPGFVFVPHELVGLQAVGTAGGGGCPSLSATHFMGLDGVTSYPITTTTVYQSSACGTTSATATSIDGSGITATFSYSAGGAAGVTSAQNASGWTWTNSTNKLADPFGNTVTWSSPLTSFTDALGAATTLGTATQGYGSPSSYEYTDTTGTSQTISLVAGTNTTFTPLSSCGANTSVSVTPASSFSFPDGTSISLTWDSVSGSLDGMIKSFKNRNGGTITYTYGTVNCSLWSFNTLSRQTPDGTTSYSSSFSSGVTTTTKLDPGKNKIVYTFYGSAPVNVTNTIARYQNTGTIASPSYTEISSTTYCYNNASCSTAPSYPITQLDVYEYTYKPDGTQVQMSHEVETFDSTYGLLLTDANTDSINSQTITKTIVYGTWNGSACVAITNTAVVDHPCTITVKNGTTQLSYKTFTYNSNGAPTASTEWINSTDTLTTNYTANSNGTMATMTLPNSQVITYTYNNCNGLLPTDVTTTVNGVVIDNKKTWNCNAAVVTDTTDSNSNEDDYVYDSMNRISSYTDRNEQVTNFAYGTPTLDHVKETDPLNVVTYQYNDGLGRPTNTQVCQTTGCSNLDTSSESYAWNGVNFEIKSYVPCVKTILNSPCTTVALTTDANPIFGPVSSTDANNGTVTFALNSKDFSVTAGPAPSGENTKIVQKEIDGFGRTTSTCGLLSSGGTSCGQTMGNSGILTSNTYSFGTGSSTISTTRGSQTHTTVRDALGRVTSTTTPEAGTYTYTYDTEASCGPNGSYTKNGALLSIKDNAGNYQCLYYDNLNRMTDEGNSNQSATNYCKRFRFDSTANALFSAPSGYPTSNNSIIGRLVEAETDNCSTWPVQQSSVIADEWFAYDKDGRTTDMWQLDPNSGGAYRHTTMGYDADGTITSLSGLPGISALTYVTDGEDRWNTATLGSTTVLSGVTYDAASRPTLVDVGASNSGYWDTFSYDNLGNMTQYAFNVNSNNNTGNLTWSANGSLRQLAVTDTLNSSNAQTCTFGTSSVMGYDDVGRLLSDNCGSVWAQTYSYDQYDNLTKSGSLSWNPGYSSSNNEYQNGATYDSNGNLKTDGANNTYTWNVYNKMASENGTSATYDAFGHMVAFGNREYLYSPMGLLGNFTSGVSNQTMLPMPGRGTLDVDSGGGLHFYHPDWLGSNRTATGVNVTGHVDWDKSYSPYGDAYNSTSVDVQFAGMNDDTSTGVTYSTPNRELATNASRWLSPDPAGASWNAYSYVTDPNRETDPSGLGSDPDVFHPKLPKCVDTKGQGPCRDAQDWTGKSAGDGNSGGGGTIPLAIGMGFIGSTDHQVPMGPIATGAVLNTFRNSTAEVNDWIIIRERIVQMLTRRGAQTTSWSQSTIVRVANRAQELEQAAVRANAATYLQGQTYIHEAIEEQSTYEMVKSVGSSKEAQRALELAKAYNDKMMELRAGRNLRTVVISGERAAGLSLGTKILGATGLALEFLFNEGDDINHNQPHSPDIVDLWDWLSRVNTGLPTN